MAQISRVRVGWSGTGGGPGVSTFYCKNAGIFQGPLQTFLTDISANLPVGVSLLQEPAGDVIDEFSGSLVGSWTGSAQAIVQGTNAISHAAPAGVQVQWLTDTIAHGRRLRGRTFLVPFSAGAFQGDGTVIDANVVELQGFAQDLIAIAAANFVIWSRPFPGTPSWTDVHGRVHAAKPARDGVAGDVKLSRVPDKVVVLRSRRD